MTDRVGQQFGNYRLLHLLGQGGFADVYLAEHIHLETQVAIKVLSMRLTGDNVEQFRTEARTVARLVHPYIVRVLDFGIEDNIPYLAMDYAPHGSLRKLYPKGTRLPLDTILNHVKQASEALQYAHEKKLIHRDIKPENMLLGENHQVLLSDFGIALVAQSTRYQNTLEVMGTAAYMAPEQLQGKPRRASDQYSLGIMVYEWICGDRPFHGSFTEIYSQHLFVPPLSLCERVPGLSQTVEKAVFIALAKDPKERFDSIQAFATAFEQACQVAPASPIALPSEVSSPGQPLLSTQTVAAFPPSQLSYSTNVFAPPSQLSQSLVVTTASNIPIVPSPSVRESVLSDEHQPFQPSKHQISRRAIVIGLAGLTGVSIVGSGLAWLTRSQKPQVSSHVPHSPITPIPLRTPLYTYHGHTNAQYGEVNAVAWSPDSRRIASASMDTTVQVWDATDGGNVFTYHRHSDDVHTVAWSPDGQRIVSGAGGHINHPDNTVQVWNVTDGSRLFIYQDGSYINAVAWSPDGNRIAFASGDNTVQVWNIANDSSLFTYRGHSSDSYGVLAIAWSPDGKHIVSGGSDNMVNVWDATTGSTVFTYSRHSNFVNAVAWSPDGKRIASGSGDPYDTNHDFTVQVWDATDGGNVFTYRGHSSWGVHAVAWSPDGQRIVSGGADTTVQVWDALNGGNVSIYKGHSDWVYSVAWSPDGKRIASGSYDKTVQVWQAF